MILNLDLRREGVCSYVNKINKIKKKGKIKKMLHGINRVPSRSSELMANTLEATSKDIEEKSNIFSSTLAAYITKKMLDITMKIEAIGVIINGSRFNR